MVGGDVEGVLRVAAEHDYPLPEDHVPRFLRSRRIVGVILGKPEEADKTRPTVHGFMFYYLVKNYIYVSHILANDRDGYLALLARLLSKIGEKRKYFLMRAWYDQADLLDVLKGVKDDEGYPRVGFKDTDLGYYLAQMPRSNVRPIGVPKELFQIESGEPPKDEAEED